MAKAAKKKAASKKRAEHYEPKVKTDLSFDELIAMSVGKNTKEKTMTPMQKDIVNKIKNGFGGYGGGDYTTTIHAIYALFKNERKEDIDTAIASWDGLNLDSNNLEAKITIPAKYFKD